jgi:hypothetical protein
MTSRRGKKTGRRTYRPIDSEEEDAASEKVDDEVALPPGGDVSMGDAVDGEEEDAVSEKGDDEVALALPPGGDVSMGDAVDGEEEDEDVDGEEEDEDVDGEEEDKTRGDDVAMDEGEEEDEEGVEEGSSSDDGSSEEDAQEDVQQIGEAACEELFKDLKAYVRKLLVKRPDADIPESIASEVAINTTYIWKVSAVPLYGSLYGPSMAPLWHTLTLPHAASRMSLEIASQCATCV